MLSTWKNYKLYNSFIELVPGCCAEHDRITLASKISFTSKADTISISNGFSPTKTNIYSDIQNNNLSPTKQPQYSDSLYYGHDRSSDEISDRYCQDSCGSRISFSPTKQSKYSDASAFSLNKVCNSGRTFKIRILRQEGICNLFLR